MLFGAGAALGGGEGSGMMAGGGLIGGLAIMVLVPLFYLVLGFVFGLIYAVFINLALRLIGGLEIEIG
jgi:hypothetical protein